MIASFASKVFEAGNNKAYLLNNLSYSGGLETETQENEGGKASTYIKGVALESMTFSIPLHHKFVNVCEEISSWNQIRDAKVPYILVLAGRQLGQNKWLLKSTSVNPVLGPGGIMLSAELNLTFEEYVRAGKKSTSGSSSAAKSTRITKNKEAEHKFSAEALAIIADIEKTDNTKAQTKKTNGIERA